MIVLNTAGAKIEAKCSHANKVNIHLNGVIQGETVPKTNAYSPLNAGNILMPTDTRDTYYTNLANKVVECFEVLFCNITGDTVTVSLWGNDKLIFNEVTLLARQTLSWNKGVITIFPDSTTISVGDFEGCGKPPEVPDGLIHVFTAPADFVADTVILKLNGLAQERGVDYAETPPNQITFVNAPHAFDIVTLSYVRA